MPGGIDSYLASEDRRVAVSLLEKDAKASADAEQYRIEGRTAAAFERWAWFTAINSQHMGHEWGSKMPQTLPEEDFEDEYTRNLRRDFAAGDFCSLRPLT
jgi:hypothetical protein